MFVGKGGSSIFSRFSRVSGAHSAQAQLSLLTRVRRAFSARVRRPFSVWSQCPLISRVRGVFSPQSRLLLFARARALFSARANCFSSDGVYRSARRVSVLLLLAVLPASLFGCGASPKREIGWQEYPFTIKAEAECRERFGDSGADIRITATAPGEGELKFLAPDTLKGLCISVHDGAGEVRLGELCSPLRGSVLEDVRALFSLTALDTSRMTDIYLEDGEGRVNVAQITLCLPASDGAAAETSGAGSAENAGSEGGADSGTDDGVETVGMLTVRIDSETGNPLEMQADFISGEALRLRIYEYSSDGAADGMTD